jgi:hypothetical protein
MEYQASAGGRRAFELVNSVLGTFRMKVCAAEKGRHVLLINTALRCVKFLRSAYKPGLQFCMATLALAAMCVTADAQQAHRPPAVPLAVNDPYFSLWSMGNTLNGSPIKHWTEVAQPMFGLARVDGANYSWMGASVRPRREHIDATAMEQKAVEVTPLHTRYTFIGGGVELHVVFMTPLFPWDMDVLSRPVTYLTWSAMSIDGKAHEVSLLLDVTPQVAINDPSEQVTWSRTHSAGVTSLNVGSRDQAFLNRSGDRIRINWGYFHLAVPDDEPAKTELSAEALQQFIQTGTLADSDDLSMPRPAQSTMGQAAHLAVMLPMGKVSETAVERHVMLAYTQTWAVEYLGRRLHEYWQRNGMTESELLATAEREYRVLEGRAVRFDGELMADMRRVGGNDYVYLTSLLFRQTIGAHKLVADLDGTPFLFSKENDSNGCIDTVDVTYPSSPFFLLFNPELLKAQLEPLMRYAAMQRWKFPFAPHDLGTFPLADGQVYGGGEINEIDQMPVEESGNLLIMIDALGREEGNYDFAKKYMPQIEKWADFLAAKGLDPENQLSTDDFAGHLAHNTNLSIKAIEALGAFVQIARGVGDLKLAAKYDAIVSKMPAEWERMALDGDHYKLAFDQPGTWSQKYNLVWDDLLDLRLFPKKIPETEWAFYARHMQPYGLPLDNRKTITKLDWEVWTATLTQDQAQYNDLIHRLVVWADSTVSRVPTTDYYDTLTGKQQAFQARSVVGGIFIKALADKSVGDKYRHMR